MATSLGEAPASADSPTRERERFWNVPNTITMVRLIVVPVLVAFPIFPWLQQDGWSLAVAWLFVLAALGDVVDGWAARRGQQVTRIGKLLDPLADKWTVAVALIALLMVGRIPAWGFSLVVVILGRELAVSGLRGMASEDGNTVAAAWPGKVKTLAQNVAIACLLFPDFTLGVANHTLGMSLLGVATALTLWSGYVYFARVFGHPES